MNDARIGVQLRDAEPGFSLTIKTKNSISPAACLAQTQVDERLKTRKA
jgi:hypothetical protein